MSKVCHIVGGGDFFGIRPTGEGDFIIAADKGLLYLQNLGITPNLVIGDFDSLGHTPNGRNIIVLPCEKNDTDMGAAVAEGVMRGYKNSFSTAHPAAEPTILLRISSSSRLCRGAE